MSALPLLLLELRRLLRDQRGQAMVEYSTLTFLILIGMAGAGFAMPLPGHGGQSLVHALYTSLQIYVDSIFYSLSLAIP